ncbi:HNH endonuclease [Nostoc sp.]|uniref:HNH endonuclease n=1 Tax=Nostoc sp. TaxID=1180 RepID=UPI003FA5EE11
MHCIFCKCNSSSSTSREHIIPESFGNKEHTLPPGVVCDRCNNYIARKVEKPLLDSPYFKEQRFKMSIPSKRNKIPMIRGIHLL